MSRETADLSEAQDKMAPELEEAGRMSGAGWLRTIKDISIPVLRSGVSQATAKTKKRHDVNGSGIKPWRQKGTGRRPWPCLYRNGVWKLKSRFVP